MDAKTFKKLTGKSIRQFSTEIKLPYSRVKGHIHRNKCKIIQDSKYPCTHPSYRTWASLFERCYNSDSIKYSRYGGRGIKVCSRWFYSFDNFVEDMGLRPGPEYSIDRIDNDGDYCPENCRWTTQLEQNINRSTTGETPGLTYQKGGYQVHIRGKYYGFSTDYDTAVTYWKQACEENALPYYERYILNV